MPNDHNIETVTKHSLLSSTTAITSPVQHSANFKETNNNTDQKNNIKNEAIVDSPTHSTKSPTKRKRETSIDNKEVVLTTYNPISIDQYQDTDNTSTTPSLSTTVINTIPNTTDSSIIEDNENTMKRINNSLPSLLTSVSSTLPLSSTLPTVISTVPSRSIAESSTSSSSNARIHTSRDICKMAIILRNDVGMGKGKLCAQASHATLIAYKHALNHKQKIHKEMINDWEFTGQTKIVLKVNSEEELQQLASQAHKEGLPYGLVRDAGHTQVEAGTYTALAIGPSKEKIINTICGHLKLL